MFWAVRLDSYIQKVSIDLYNAFLVEKLYLLIISSPLNCQNMSVSVALMSPKGAALFQEPENFHNVQAQEIFNSCFILEFEVKLFKGCSNSTN